MAMLPPPNSRFLRIGLVLGVLAVSGAIAANEKLPIHVPTDGAKWYGNDGQWSTMTLRLGNPVQTVYLLAGMSSSITTAVGSVWCNDPNSGYSCDLRGRSFTPANSNTWTEIGQYDLELTPELIETNLRYTSKDFGFGQFGRESIKIGGEDGRGPVMDRQTIAVVNDTTHLLGSLGLNLKSRSFVDEEQYPSFVSSLFDTGTIPSKSYGYTAGNFERRTPTDLVLGGKNLGRYVPHSVSFALDANQNPVASLNTITVSGTGTPPWGAGAATLMVKPALVQIDSTTPFLWLPETACRQFESYLGLTWNSTSNLYIMNDTESLVGLNLTFSFTLSLAVGSTDQVTIEIPYTSFDLKISWPYVNTTEKLKYFPLKRATDEKQYTLGRAFLQDTYIVTDFARGNFSLHQAVFPPGADEIVGIVDPKDEKKDKATGEGGGLSTGAIAGIAVGAGVVLIAAIVGVFLYRRRRPDSIKREELAGDMPDGSGEMLTELPTEQKPSVWEAYGDSARKPYGTPFPTVEIAAEDVAVGPSELAAVNMDPAELSGTPRPRERYSRQGVEPAPYRNIDSPLPAQQTQPGGGMTSPMTNASHSRSVSDMSAATPDSRPHSNAFSPISPEHHHVSRAY